MALFVVATPIGNPQDISLHALEILKTADLIVGEELKALRQILKAAGVQAQKMDQLNEHSTADDVEFLKGECRSKKVALVSDCGTPGFCDPGADLVKACHDAGIEVKAAPGASSLMTFLSICGLRLDQFLFYGFLPAKNELRSLSWKEIHKESRPVIVMETPYRCQKFVEELGNQFPNRLCVLGLNLTQPSEQLIRAKGKDLKQKVNLTEAEIIALVMP